MKKANHGKSYFIYWLFAIVSMVLVFISFKFSINDFVSHPQFENFQHFRDCIENIKQAGKVQWFNWFFYVDFIWAFLLLLCMFKIIRAINSGQRKISIWLYLIFAITAYFLDVTENFYYLSYMSNNQSISTLFETVIKLKKIAYLLAFFVFAYNVYKRYLQKENRNIYLFIKTASLSIFSILIITILITRIDQGGTIVVELLSSWHQVAFMFFLVNFLAIIISHYPIYMQIWNVLDKPFEPDGLRLKMSKLGPVIFGFGIIYFIPQEDKEYDPFITRILRRSLGIFLYMSMFYVVLFVAQRYFEWETNTLLITLLITIFLLFFFYFMEKTKRNFENVLYGKCKGDKYDAARNITWLFQWYPLALLIGLLTVLVAALTSWIADWSRLTVVIMLIVLLINTLSYIYFRLSRPYLRYIFYSEKLNSSNPNLIDQNILAYFQNDNRATYLFFNNLIFKTGQKLANLSDNRKYLDFMRIGGLVSLLIIFLINLLPLCGYLLNPLNVILLYIIFYYSIIIIFLKHMLFYSKTVLLEESEPPFASFRFYQPVFKYFFPVLMVVLIVWGFYSTSVGNDLHSLTFVEERQHRVKVGSSTGPDSLIDTEAFINAFNPYVENDTINAYFVASYGGGLKANLWNMLILNKLNDKSNFFRNTLCFSGVSGGAIGLGNYLRVYENFETYEDRNKANRRVGESNLLSTEIAYLLGADFLRRFIPVKDVFHDRGRSYYSMKQHALNTCDTCDIKSFNTSSFRSKWSEVVYKKGYYPALIINSTSTKGRQGVALSVFTKDTIVPASDDIVFFEDRKGKSLSYYGVLSTSNRFPFLSPAAKIEGKGYYLDGGYFENSGLLSASEFRNYILPHLKKSKPFDSTYINPIFINIINSKEYYAVSKLMDWEIELNYENGLASGELSAILSTLVSTEKLPRYVTETIIREGEEKVEKIMMPHKLDYKYLISILGGEPKNPLRLIKLIEVNNEKIDKALEGYSAYKLKKWGVVTPPLSRLLGKAAVTYQEAMINQHSEIKSQINQLKKRVTPELRQD
jgi:hypothetical protein